MTEIIQKYWHILTSKISSIIKCHPNYPAELYKYTMLAEDGIMYVTLTSEYTHLGSGDVFFQNIQFNLIILIIETLWPQKESHTWKRL